MAAQKESEGFAIIGMSGRFPGAENVGQFWRNLCDGRECITQFSADQLVAAGVTRDELEDPAFVMARGVLDRPGWFDAGFFRLTPREAGLTDPQHRVFLECCWHAFEDAGYVPGEEGPVVGVFASCSLNTYFLRNVLASAEGIQRFTKRFQADDYGVLIGNDKDYLASRIAHKLDLHGPAMTVQTACSSSLVAIGQAVAALGTFQCDMALAGGVSITFPQERGWVHQEGAIPSADGHCRAYDAAASGVVFGSGCGVILLKRLEDAVADNDLIYAVIRSVAINNDGADKMSFGAPSQEGQAEVIAMAQALAGVAADQIGYVEGHGTATPLGDPIEVAALTQAFRMSTDRRGYCGLGSVKTNIGHLESAAGVTSIIKTALALKHRFIPPTLHFSRPNPEIDFEQSPFYVVSEGRSWADVPGPRHAGVSSFGVGGTNAHAVLQEAPEPAPRPKSGRSQLVVFSAESPEGLEEARKGLKRWFDEATSGEGDHNSGSGDVLKDASHTLQVGRRRFRHRGMVVAATEKEAARLLEKASGSQRAVGEAGETHRIVFLFPGQGAQHVNMARAVYDSEPVFRRTFDQCAERLGSELDQDLRGVVYPEGGDLDQAERRLSETRYAQPALFAIEYSLSQLWMSWGIRPAAFIGHSVGEFVAATLAEVLSLEDALRLVALRGAMMQEMPPGAMLAIRAGESDVQPLLRDSLAIATVNSPKSCVVAGAVKDVQTLQAELKKRHVATRPLSTAHAFHTAMMEPAIQRLNEVLPEFSFRPARLPIISTLYGRQLEPDAWVDGSYWGRQLREPVRFYQAVSEVSNWPDAILLEVGPGQTLGALARQTLSGRGNGVVASSLPAPGQGDDRTAMLLALGKLWVSGVEPDWAAINQDGSGRRVSLPGYPFQRQLHWLEPAHARAAGDAPQQAATGRDGSGAESADLAVADLEQLILGQLAVMSEQLDKLARRGCP